MKKVGADPPDSEGTPIFFKNNLRWPERIQEFPRCSDLIEVFCDGLCEPRNPYGVATYDFTSYRDDVKLHRGCGVIAEYSALCSAFKYLLEKNMAGEEIIVKSDPKLLVNQMNGCWSCHGGLYVSKHLEALDLQRSFNKVKFRWIPRG